MSAFGFLVAAAGGDVTRQRIWKRTLFQTRRSEGWNFMSHLLPGYVSSPAGESNAEHFEGPLGAFFIGAGDQFDDDRRRIHIVK
ncbi:MAG: hypothetical protein AB7V46_16580 [Thermomicrobiales bacterium]